MSIKSIKSRNLQSHDDISIELTETGVVRFLGDNNDGKSVLTKGLWALISNRIAHESTRKPLINYDADYAEIEVVKYNGDRLLAHIELSAKNTYVLLVKDGIEIKRYLSEKGIPELVLAFGFHYDKKRDMSLNIYQTYDPLLFITTNGVTNMDIMSYAISDAQAERALENLLDVIKDLKKMRDELKSNSEYTKATIAGLSMYDIEAETAKRTELVYLRQNLPLLTVLDLPDMPAIPDISNLLLLDTYRVEKALDDISAINDRALYDLDILLRFKALPNLTVEIKEYLELVKAKRDNICPTCGRSYSV